MQDSQLKVVKEESFPRAARLLNGREYTHVFDKAKAYGTRGYTLLIRSNPGQGARLGMVVGKKKLKRAVDRNLFKRLTRDSFRRHRHLLPDVDIIVIAKPLSRERIQDITADLARHWLTIRKTISSPRSGESS